MKTIKTTKVNDDFLDELLGIKSSKIGFYSEVKQKIQELETANLDLQIKRSEIQAVFNAISDAVIIYDNLSLVQHRNQVAPRFFYHQSHHGASCRVLFHNERATDPQNCPVEKALKGKNAQMSFSRQKTGQSRPQFYDVIATPIVDPIEGNRALVFIRDVTEKRNRELQLLQAEKLSSVGVLAAGVAHEINNPLTSVAGYAEALQRRLRDDPALAGDQRLCDFPGYLDVIVREAYRCKGIIDSLLSFSRKSDGSFGRVDLNEIIAEVLELVRHKQRDAQIDLDTNLQIPLPPIEGDASALRQVFLNLVMNALQSIEEIGDKQKHHIQIQTSSANNQV